MTDYAKYEALTLIAELVEELQALGVTVKGKEQSELAKYEIWTKYFCMYDKIRDIVKQYPEILLPPPCCVPPDEEAEIRAILASMSTRIN